MELSWGMAAHVARAGGALDLDLGQRPFGRAGAERSPPRFSLTLHSRAGLVSEPSAVRRLRGAAAFLADVAHPAVPVATLARMIGCFAWAAGMTGPGAALAVTLRDSRDGHASALLARPAFEIETTRFGFAHILHEDDVLGLYILEISPGRMIPPHCHRVMRESELILDDGLLLQGRPVAAGDAFVWPLGQVHTYQNPTGTPRCILCVDSPRFQPSDEVPIYPPPVLEPAAPIGNYLA